MFPVAALLVAVCTVAAAAPVSAAAAACDLAGTYFYSTGPSDVIVIQAGVPAPAPYEGTVMYTATCGSTCLGRAQHPPPPTPPHPSKMRFCQLFGVRRLDTTVSL